jgi:pantoate kinase
MKGIAFTPGHISAFFEPVYYPQNMDRTGSCGAGMSLSFGAISQVSIQPSLHQIITVHFNGKASTASVTKSAVHYLLGEAPLKIVVNTIMDLPVSQGFGMSAAGALSTTLALADLLNLPPENAIKAAHYAEIQSHTGLGDVIASSFGGIEIRRKAGLPPWGMLEHIPGNYEIVLCVVGKKIETKKILTNSTTAHKIASFGRYCTKKILEKPTLEHLFSLGWEFTRKIGIANTTVLQAIEVANAYGMASMCMLGNAVYAVGDTPALCRVLSTYGKVFCCTVDEKGARVLHEK